MSVFAFGYDELKKLPDIKSIEDCPSCGKRHRTRQSIDADGIPGGLYFVTCPKDQSTWVVGVKGKRIPKRKGKR